MEGIIKENDFRNKYILFVIVILLFCHFFTKLGCPLLKSFNFLIHQTQHEDYTYIKSNIFRDSFK